MGLIRTGLFRTFGVTRDYITWMLRALQITVNPGRVGRETYSANTPARVFLPRRSTAIRPANSEPLSTDASSSTRTLFT